MQVFVELMPPHVRMYDGPLRGLGSGLGAAEVIVRRAATAGGDFGQIEKILRV